MPFPIANIAGGAGLRLLAAVIGLAVLSGVFSLAWAQDARDQPNGLRGTAAAQQPSLRGDPRTTGLRGTTNAAANPVLETEDSTVPPNAAGVPGAGGTDDSSNVINYGRPRPKPPKLFTPKSPLYAPDTRVSPPLPPLMPYATAPGTKKRNSNAAVNPVSAADTAAAKTAAESAGAAQAAPAVPDPTVAVLPWTPPPLRPRLEDKPFAPIGVDAGSLRLLPFVELGSGYDTNPNRLSSNVKGSPYGRAAGGLDVNSQWETHSLTATLRGGYSDYFSFHEADRPDVQTKVDGRVDVTRDTAIDLEGRGTLDTQQPGSQQLAIPGSSFIVGRPLIETFGGTAGVTQHFGRVAVRLRGTFDRFQYQDAELSDGSTLLLSENDYNDIGVNGRVSYELTPGLIPYVDITGDERVYDSLFDFKRLYPQFEGHRRQGRRDVRCQPRHPRRRPGLWLCRPPLRRSAPHQCEGPDDRRQHRLDSSALTKVTLTTGTDFVETTLTGGSAAISRRVSLEIAHSFFRNFTLTGSGRSRSIIMSASRWPSIFIRRLCWLNIVSRAMWCCARPIGTSASSARNWI